MASRLAGRRYSRLQDPKAWHNVFAREVFARIDEESYSVLYPGTMGRPNAPIKTLLAMMLLKEGNSWTDEQLFEECDFNLLVLQAIGYSDFDQQTLAPAAYYNFRRRLAEYQAMTDINLIDQTFKHITSQQVKAFKVAGRTIRMDSKLLGSNIAFGNRVQLVLEAVRVHLRDHTFTFKNVDLTDRQVKIVEKLKVKSAANLSYRLDGLAVKAMLLDLGHIIKAMIAERSAEELPLLARVFQEQYAAVAEPNQDHDEDEDEDLSSNKSIDTESTGETSSDEVAKDEASTTEVDDKHTEISVRESSEIASGSLQSVHDPEAAYRSKGFGDTKQQVRGYHVNVTEVCDEGCLIKL